MANIPQWKVGDVLSASKLNAMVDAINDLLAGQTDNSDVYITLDELNDILKQYSDVGHTHSVNEIVDLVLPTKLSQLQNDTLYVTEDYVTNAIANAQLGGDGEVDLSAYATKNYVDSEIDKIELTPGPQGEQGPKGETGEQGPKGDDGYTPIKGVDYFTTADKEEMLSGYATEKFVSDSIANAQLGGDGEVDAYTKEEVNNIIQDYTGGKKQVYLTQAEYDALNDDDKNDETKVYNIIDVEDTVADSLILTSPNGSKFVIIVSDDGTLSATPYENVEPEEPVEPVEPVSYTNYIYNEDTFTNPAAGTVPSASTYYYFNEDATAREVVEPGVLKIYNKTEGTNAGLLVRHGKGDSNIYYIQFKVKSEAAIISGSPQRVVLSSKEPVEDWTMVSFIYTDTSSAMYSIKLTLNNNGAIPGVAYIKELMRINLTEIYGAGNEPSDVNVCDETFAVFVPGLRG